MSMANLYSTGIRQERAGLLSVALCGLLLAVTGCNPDKDDGKVLNNTPLPTDTRLSLQCADVGIFTETCVLDDPNNPFRTSPIKEFDVNGPEDQETKFDQIAELIPPDDPANDLYYSKSKFYFWATALARFPSGENQYFTAVALHELYTIGGGADGGSPNARDQAIRAYRSVLDNFFGSVTFLSTCDFLFPSPPQPEFLYSVIVSDSTGKNLVDPPGPTTFTDCDGVVNDVLGLVTLFPEATPVNSEFKAREVLGEWGYSYIEVDDDTAFVTVSNFP
jgi:hypothetical protein